MPELVSIPLSFFELSASYLDPDITATFIDRKDVVKALFDALKAWKITMDDIELVTQGKLSDHGVKFMLPQKQVSVFVGAASLRFTKDNASWDLLQETAEILSAALSAVASAGKLNFASFRTIASMHLQLKTGHFMDILQPLVPPELAAVEAEKAKTMASVVVWSDRKITVDGSGAIANAIFLRLERDFSATRPSPKWPNNSDMMNCRCSISLESRKKDDERLRPDPDLWHKLAGRELRKSILALPRNAEMHCSRSRIRNTGRWRKTDGPV